MNGFINKRFLIIAFSTIAFHAALYPFEVNFNQDFQGGMLETRWIFNVEDIYDICVSIYLFIIY